MQSTPPGKLRVEVTHLEMPRPPVDFDPVPPENGLEIEILAPPNVELYRYLYNTVGEAWLWGDRRNFSDRQIADIFDGTKVELLLLRAAGEPAGFAELDDRGTGGILLAYFGILPDFTGRKFGPFLLGCFLREAWSRSPPGVLVNTCTLDHPAALPMYERAGFVQVRRVTELHDDPRVLGLIPVDVAPHHPIVA